jgi:hypothetical protein
MERAAVPSDVAGATDSQEAARRADPILCLRPTDAERAGASVETRHS